MKQILRLGVSVTIALTVLGCASDRKHPKSPESSPEIAESSSQPDMPPPPSKESDATTAAASGKDKDSAASAGAAGGMIPVAAMKMVPAKKGKTDKAVELKDDGTVSVDGKPSAKFSGDQLQDASGITLVTVGVDGSLVGNGVKSGFKFSGDDLVNDSGTKLAMGDDGTISSTKDGKTEPVAKIEGGSSAKRAALVMAVVWMSSQGAFGSAAAPAKSDAKAGAKTPKK